ncbi:MAG: dockerin type I domain-containing protein [Pirellulaceae bacterium]|nr:dockerin type I domain-containing protein [Pirellulaceae bacterium]
MDTLQTELDADYPQLDIQMLGVNWVGLEAANSEMVAGKELPWLQDVDSDRNGKSDVWEDWGTDHLDLVVLDAQNQLAAKTTLTTYNLATPANYAGLRDALVDIAMAAGHSNHSPWQNYAKPLDVDGNGQVVPLDALLIINRLNEVGSQRLPSPAGNQSPPPYYDTNGDGELAPLDALLIINFLNAPPASAAGEGESLLQLGPLLAADVSANITWPNPRSPGPSSSIRSFEDFSEVNGGLTRKTQGAAQPGQTVSPSQADRVFSAVSKDWLNFDSSDWEADIVAIDL